jgi:hypothetical protein
MSVAHITNHESSNQYTVFGHQFDCLLTTDN